MIGGGIRSCTSKYDTALRVCLLGVCVCDAVKYERVYLFFSVDFIENINSHLD